ncbi:MAG: CDP-diacylglycerol--glycerol-3-phosphate 3-phosphatidyltransferase [Rickettsiales bacterium]|jgi:CDP-diacylglycerol--glycerol-3-phosphate 3-phosphatidyltransferase|nr:CDP-diacylglycerol--glycerol-3-phosphate 3-phosphatidyltransferase [Rickettsiales bacterium]
MFKKDIPNVLTILRIILIPLLVVSFFVPWKITNLIVSALFSLAGITDYFDGYFARLFKVQSDFGRCFDPIADKLLVSVALVMLVQFSDSVFLLIPSLIIICREILVSGLREYLVGLNVKIAVTRLAKWKTALQIIGVTGLLLSSKNSNYTYDTIMNIFEVEPLTRIDLYGVIEKLSTVILNIAALLTVITGYAYLKVGLKNMKQ